MTDYKEMYYALLKDYSKSLEEIRNLKSKLQGASISAGRWKSKANQLQEVA